MDGVGEVGGSAEAGDRASNTRTGTVVGKGYSSGTVHEDELRCGLHLKIGRGEVEIAHILKKAAGPVGFIELDGYEACKVAYVHDGER